MGISLRSSRLEEMGCPFCKFTPNCSELVFKLVVMLKLDSSSTTTVEVSSTYAYVYIIIFIGILKI